jgi:hypothetical protein
MKFTINGAGSCDKVLTGIRLTSEQHKMIKSMSEDHNISMQEVVRQMVLFAIDSLNDFTHVKNLTPNKGETRWKNKK